MSNPTSEPPANWKSKFTAWMFRKTLDIVGDFFILALFLFAVATIGYLINLVASQIVKELPWLPALQVANFYALAGAIILLALVLTIFVAFILIWLFLPILIQPQPSTEERIRSIVLTGGFLFCWAYHYLGWNFIPPLDSFEEYLNKAADSAGESTLKSIATLWQAQRTTGTGVLAFSEAFLTYVVVMLIFRFLQLFAKGLWLYANAADRGRDFLVGVFQSIESIVSKPRRSDAAGQSAGSASAGNSMLLILACFIGNSIMVAFALTTSNLMALGLAVAAIMLIVFVLASVSKKSADGSEQESEDKRRERAVESALYPIGALTLGAVMCFFINPKASANPLFGAWEHEWLWLLRYVVRDLAMGILIVVIMLWFLCDSRNSAVETNPVRGAPDVAEDRLKRRIWKSMWLFFACRGLAIVIAWVIAAFSSDVPPQKVVAGKATPIVPVMSFERFAYMAWTGDVLQADEYLYVATFEKDGQNFFKQVTGQINTGSRPAFLTDAVKVRPYYSIYYAALVLIQAVFGWNYGITLLSYLLFAYAILLFQDPPPPPPPENDYVAEAYAEKRDSAGVIARLREATEAITTLGFIGTLLGLSQAIFFLGVADEVNDFLGKSGISSRLSGSLGLAFFTTFVAMVLRLIINLRFSQLAAQKRGYQALFKRLSK